MDNVLDKDITIELLKSARAHVKKSWAQGAWIKGNGAVCAMGGIRKALIQEWPEEHSKEEEGPKEQCLGRILSAGLPEEYQSDGDEGDVIGFNDEHGRKKSEVIAVFDRAIEAYEKQHKVKQNVE
jgi:predicted ribosome quality control (RQC) complex YloA/Tae2 family protein